MIRITASLAAITACACLAGVALPTAADAKPAHKHTAVAAKHKAEKPAQAPSVDVPQDVSDMADWAVRSLDNESMPFAVLDKTAAVVAVYDADGKLLGAAPALLGSATGDDSMPGVGDMKLSDIPPDERTTPAGRFVGAFGPAAGGEDVLWVDYDTAISMHPVITSNPQEQRPERLATATPDDNRISHGCINVPAKFYKDVVQPAFSGTKGVFYILPDTKPLRDVFPDYYAQRLASNDSGPVNPTHRSRWLPFQLW